MPSVRGSSRHPNKWSNGVNEHPSISHLAAGYYSVTVHDRGERETKAEITLEQPLVLKPDVDVYEYANGYNISCHGCNNGNVSVLPLGGAQPYTVQWSDGISGSVRYNLGPKGYDVTITDANNCETVKTRVNLTEPDRDDWSMSGNSNTTPGPQYIGTSDNKDLVFKSNGQERLPPFDLRKLPNG